MKHNRVAIYDWIRALAIVCVVICHWLQGLDTAHGFIGGLLGNSLFFIMSGLLLGKQWRNVGSVPYGSRFIFRRVCRIYPAFILFTIVYSITLLCTGYMDWAKISMNFLMLSWFAKLPGAGHLWFVTGIMMLYVLLLIASRLGRVVVGHPILSCVSILVLSVAAQIAMDIAGIRQSWFIPLLTVTALAFFHGDDIIEWITLNRRKLALSPGLMLFVVMLMAIIFCLDKWFMLEHLTLAYWIGVMCAIGIVCSAFALISSDRGCPRVVSFLSGISYELYLFHYPFCMNSPLFLRRWISGNILYSIVFLVVSIGGACMLNRLVSMGAKVWKRE